MKQRKAFLLRISPELYEALEAIAQQEFRSVNGQIEFLLKESLARRGREGRERSSAADETPADDAPPGASSSAASKG
jgi:hypothetical protein